MAMLVAIQLALISLVMAEVPFNQNNSPDGWWFKIIPAGNAPQATDTPCLLPSQPVVRRDDYTYTPGIGGHKFHTNAVTWNNARRICEDEGGHLAIINSVAESRIIVDLYSKSSAVARATGNTEYASIGFHDLFNDGEYLTIHGQSVSRAGYDQWAPGQPDNWKGTGENCGSVHESGGLNDSGCNETRGFICELPFY